MSEFRAEFETPLGMELADEIFVESKMGCIVHDAFLQTIQSGCEHGGVLPVLNQCVQIDPRVQEVVARTNAFTTVAVDEIHFGDEPSIVGRLMQYRVLLIFFGGIAANARLEVSGWFNRDSLSFTGKRLDLSAFPPLIKLVPEPDLHAEINDARVEFDNVAIIIGKK